jgi:hypothetical protein
VRDLVYLALGDVQGDSIRRDVWERHGRKWALTKHARELGRKRGMSKRAYGDFRKGLAGLLPSTEAMNGHPHRLRRESKEEATPWISFEEIADLLSA